MTVARFGLRRGVAVLSSLTGVALAACGGSDGPRQDPCEANPTGPGCAAEVVSLDVTPEQVGVLRGSGVDLSVVLRQRNGQTRVPTVVQWTSSSPAVSLTISGPTARVTGLARGAATITAIAENVRDSARVTVLDVTGLNIVQDSVTLLTGATTTLQANVQADAGVSTTVAWTSNAPGVATVNGQGLVTAVAPGVARIFAASTVSASFRDSALVRVITPAPVLTSVRVVLGKPSICGGATTTARAEPLDAAGAPFPVAGVTAAWADSIALGVTRTADPLAVTLRPVVPRTYAVTATLTAGTATRSGSQNLVVQQAVKGVTVSLGATELTVGQSTQAAARIVDCEDLPVTGRTPQWSSTNTQVATVSASGLVTAVGAGTATIRASLDSVTGGASLTVAAAVDPVAQLQAVSALSQTDETILSPVLAPPAVRVLRQSGAVAAGVVVRFQVVAGGGTVGPVDSVTTDAAGVARLGAWTLGSVVGENRLTAAVTGVGTPLTFQAQGNPPTIDDTPPPTLVCRATFRCAFGATVRNRRGQPMAGVTVRLAPEPQSASSSFEHPQLNTDPTGQINTTWLLPARQQYCGTATVGSFGKRVCREAALPPFGVGVLRDTLFVLTRGGPPRRLVGVIVRLVPRSGAGAVDSRPTDPVHGVFDSNDVLPGVYDIDVPLQVGVVRNVRIFGPVVASGEIRTVRVGGIKLPAGTASGPVTICLTGPLNTDPGTVVTLFRDIGGDGTEPGRISATFNPPDAQGCVSGASSVEGEHLVQVVRAGRPVFRTTLTIDAAPPVTLNLTIP